MCKMFIGGSICEGVGEPEKACGELLVKEEGKGVLVEKYLRLQCYSKKAWLGLWGVLMLKLPVRGMVQYH